MDIQLLGRIFAVVGVLVIVVLTVFLLRDKLKKPTLKAIQKVSLTAKDGISIIGDYYPGSSNRGALLVHMMPQTRHSWDNFAPLLQACGWHVLAIDLRGHGESVGGPDGYRSFSDREHQASLVDLQAAESFLELHGVIRSKMTIIGASIGANLALWLVVDQPEIGSAVLLSAGNDYKGIRAFDLIPAVPSGRHILFVGSEDDDRVGGATAAAVARSLKDALPAGVSGEVFTYRLAGHGTEMFGKEEPELAGAILNWLDKLYPDSQQ